MHACLFMPNFNSNYVNMIKMEKSLYKAAMEGNIDFLSEVRDREIENGCWDNFSQSLTPQQNNIIHIASQYDHLHFLMCGFNFLIFTPLMISQRNAHGDTPIHLASKRGKKEIVKFLVEMSKKSVFRQVVISNEVVEKEAEEIDDEERKWAWRVTNFKGNTPLHEALINGKVEVAKFLLGADPHLANFVNNNGETPLHLAIKYNVEGDKKFATDMFDKLNHQRTILSYKKGRCSWSTKDSQVSSIIKSLLQNHKEGVYVRDKDGLTPLLQAAIHSQLRAIEIILDVCPECSEMCDPKGNTILHLVRFQSHEEAMSCMRIPELLALKDQQNELGNTPAHMAVMNCTEKVMMEEKEHGKKVIIKDHHIVMIIALLQSLANFTLKNMEGLSAAALFQPLMHRFPNHASLQELNMEIRESLTKNKQMMLLDREELILTSNKDLHAYEKIWEALESPNLNLLWQELNELESWLLDGLLRIGDLTHILLEACDINSSGSSSTKMFYHEVEELVIHLLEKNPILLCQTNIRGDTFLHTMVRDPSYEASELFLGRILELCEAERFHCPPWMMKNMEGNTPLHEALLYAPKPGIVHFLLNCDKHVVTYVNNKIESPLHVLCRTKGEVMEDVIKDIIEANKCVTYNRDAEGLTPLLKAAKAGKIEIVTKICQLSPDSAQLRDRSGKTFLHLLNMSGATKENEVDLLNTLRSNKKLEALTTVKDEGGETPLCWAIKNQRSKLAEFLIKDDVKTPTNKRLYHQLREEDTDVQYHLFLLKFSKHLHAKFEQTLMKKFDEVGKKSIFGVPEESIKDYINTIGVIAVLMATVAFEAALSPPEGGIKFLNENQKAIIRIAYWIFMVSDILTICLSIVVLFCLIWVLTGDQKDKLIITDLSIVLLQGSFVTAMISLMTGVFASTYDTSQSLAFFTVIVCSSTLLLLQKYIVMNFLQFVFLSVYLVTEVAWCALSDWLKKYGKNDTKN